MAIKDLSSITKLVVNVSVVSTVAAITLFVLMFKTPYTLVPPTFISILFFIPIVLIPSIADGKIGDVLLYFISQFIIITGIIGFIGLLGVLVWHMNS